MTLKNNSSFRLVVAIDFGTSRSGYAYAFTENPQIIGRTQWASQPVPYIKTLTQLLYSPDKKVIAWGWEASKRLADMQRVIEASDYNFFQNFKMQLRDSRNRTADGPIITTNNGQQFLVFDLIVDYLKILKDEVLKEIENATSGYLKEQEILWCLTIPAIWTDADKQLMRRAAQKAGLIGSSQNESERLLLVLEPEAAAVYCREKEKSQLQIGSRFMVVDCGGGTVDITVHEVVETGLIEIAEGTGGAYGSMYVDRYFQDYLRLKLTNEVIERYQKDEPVEYLDMMGAWERIKCDFDPQKSNEIIYFPMGAKLYKLLLREYPHILDTLAAEQDGEDQRIYINSQTMKAIFAPILDGLTKKIAEQLQKLGNQECDIMFLVGGFSSSPVLRQRIQEKFATKVKKIVTPPFPGAAIVEGAVFFGLNPEIQARCSRLTYGCMIYAPFEPEIDPKEKKYQKETGEAKCKDRFDIFIRAGDRVAVDKKIPKKYFPIGSSQVVMLLEFYATKKKEVRYTDETGVEKIGELKVAMPDVNGGLNRQVEVDIYFGQTEIKVEAKDLTSGKNYNTSLTFFSAYSPEIVAN